MAFDIIDLDKSGVITFSELISFLSRTLGTRYTELQLRFLSMLIIEKGKY